MGIKKALLAAGIFLATQSVHGADQAIPSPAKAEAEKDSPRRLTTLDFFKNPNISEAKISPDGRHLALLIPNGNTPQLTIVDTESLTITAAYQMAAGEFVSNYYWASNIGVVWEGATRLGPLDRSYLTGNLMFGRADKSDGKSLGDGLIFLERVRNAADEILVSWDRKIYRENVRTGSLKTVAVTPFDDAEVVTDSLGKVRLASGEDGADIVTDTWDDVGKQWKELQRGKFGEGRGNPLAFAGDDKRVYFSSNEDASTAGIYLVDLATDSKTLVFRDEAVDVDRLIFVPGTDEPAGVYVFRDYPTYHFFDKNSATAKIFGALTNSFPGSFVAITSSSDDGRWSTIAVESDRQPSVLYLFDRDKQSLRLLFKSRPWIDSKQMSEMSAFVIKARDGVELHGYLTTPKGVEEKNLPMVVLPHGGPHGIRDWWEYNAEVQFLAYHGYAVLQVNFRGSGGYGRVLEALGYGHWGTTMQDDVTDATHWAIDEGIADPKRICIYGASYGGYAALMGVIREPDLYRCAVSYVGTTDLLVERRFSDTAETKFGRSYIQRAFGTDTDDLKARSPVYNVDKIKVPLFLAAGGSDQRVPFENFSVLTVALNKAGKPYETLVKDNEGHGFYLESNKVEFYDRMLHFIDTYTGTVEK